MQLERLAQMVSDLNDRLVKEGFNDPYITARILAAATPELTRKVFNG